MTLRERVTLALDHEQPDRVPLDLGGSTVTGMHVDIVYQLRQSLSLDEPGTPVRVIEPHQRIASRPMVAGCGTLRFPCPI